MIPLSIRILNECSEMRSDMKLYARKKRNNTKMNVLFDRNALSRLLTDFMSRQNKNETRPSPFYQLAELLSTYHINGVHDVTSKHID